VRIWNVVGYQPLMTRTDTTISREYSFTSAIAEVFRSGTFFKRRFDDSNMQRLIAMMNGETQN